MAQTTKKTNFIEDARNLFSQITSNAKNNLQAWGQVASNPQLRQDYTQQVAKPFIQSVASNVIKPYSAPINLTRPVANIATEAFKSNIYNPQTKQIFPNAMWNATSEINKFPINSPQRRQAEIGMANQVVLGMIGGLKIKGGTKAIMEAEKMKFKPQAGGVGGGGMGGTSQLKSLQPEVQKTTTGKVPQVPKTVVPEAMGGGQPNVQEGVSSTPIIPQLGEGNFLQRITEALKSAGSKEKQQAAIYHQVKSKQAGALAGIGEQLGGEAGYYQKLGQLKGELPKVQFESIRKQVSQGDVNQIFNMVEKSNLGVFEKVNAQTALKKLMGAEGGSVPTKGELELLNQVFPADFIQAILEKRSLMQKLFSLGEEGLNLPRAMMATADLSAPLRQGIFLIGRPKQWLPAFRDMFKYAFSEKAYRNLADDIKVRPNSKLYREANLAITDINPILGSREEMFMSNLAEKIPIFGKIARGSNRAYSGFLNKLRVDVFDDLVNGARKEGLAIEGKTLADIGKFVNSATGRGEIGSLQKIAPLLNGIFFSPRLMMSRINLLNPVYYAKLDPFVRKEAVKSLITFTGTALTVLGLSKLAGAQVGADPRSADFGKIKVGNTRYDILGGFQQYIRFIAQMITGQRISTTTGKLMTVGEGFNAPTRKDIAMSFFENKEAPIPSLITALMTGKTAIGGDVNLPAEIIDRFIPMFLQDASDLIKEYGPVGALMSLPGVMGAGSQTYGTQELVKGKNQLGQQTSQLKAPVSIGEAISSKIFGQPTLSTTPQYSADAYFKQLQKLPPQEAAQKFDEIAKSNPELAKKIVQAAKDFKLGITPANETLKTKGVANGDRAVALKKEFDKLKTPEEKAKLWDEYVKKGIITKEVAQQLTQLLKGGQ